MNTMKREFENPPKNDLAGLRNQVRLIQVAVDNGDLQEVGLQLDGLLDDLLGSGVKFSWRTAADRAKDAERNRRSIAAYCESGLAD
jgi:hypothetical protein